MPAPIQPQYIPGPPAGQPPAYIPPPQMNYTPPANAAFPVYNPEPSAGVDSNIGMGMPVNPGTDKANNADTLAGGGGNDMDDLEARLRALDGK